MKLKLNKYWFGERLIELSWVSAEGAFILIGVLLLTTSLLGKPESYQHNANLLWAIPASHLLAWLIIRNSNRFHQHLNNLRRAIKQNQAAHLLGVKLDEKIEQLNKKEINNSESLIRNIGAFPAIESIAILAVVNKNDDGPIGYAIIVTAYIITSLLLSRMLKKTPIEKLIRLNEE